MYTLDPQRLEEAVLERLRSVVPTGVKLSGGSAVELLKSWDVDSEWAEALEFVTRRVLEEQQEDIILQIHQGWPEPAGDLATPEVEIVEADEIVRLRFSLPRRSVLVLPDVPFSEIS